MPIQIIPENRKPSFGQRLNVGIGRGLEMGQQLMDRHTQQKQFENTKRQLSELTGMDLSSATPEMLEDAAKFYFQGEQQRKLEELKQSGKEGLLKRKQDFLGSMFGSGEQKQSSQMNQESPLQQGGFDPSQISDQDILQASAIDPVLGRMLQQQKDVSVREKRETEKFKREEERYQEGRKTAKEREFFKINEPKVIALGDNLNKLEMEKLRYDRLGQLFQNPENFPSSFTAALFTKEGNINDIVYSQLTPDAQEAIKLIVDSTSGIKDTYGARVTNFDLQTYLKKLPSLLNTPEGKMRVLRDLQMMNQLNQMHARGIMEVFEESGGTDKIPYSKAEQIYKKRYKEEEENLKNLFVHPEKETFDDLPDAGKFLGRKIRNPETGEILISDGNEWKPYKG